MELQPATDDEQTEDEVQQNHWGSVEQQTGSAPQALQTGSAAGQPQASMKGGSLQQGPGAAEQQPGGGHSQQAQQPGGASGVTDEEHPDAVFVCCNGRVVSAWEGGLGSLYVEESALELSSCCVDTCHATSMVAASHVCKDSNCRAGRD
jgi:hypothetical protein